MGQSAGVEVCVCVCVCVEGGMRQGITMEEEEEEEDGRRRADRVRVWSLFDDKRWVCQVRSAQDMGGGSWRALCVCVCVCVCACFVEGRTQQASLSSSCVLSVWVLSRCSVLDSSSPLLTVLMLGRSQVNIFKKSVGMLETESRGHGYTHTHTHNLRHKLTVGSAGCEAYRPQQQLRQPSCNDMCNVAGLDD